MNDNTAPDTKPATPAPWPAMSDENRLAIPTEQAAYYLNRRPQTLRGWACKEDGPLVPLRLHGRLMWPMSEIRRLLNVRAYGSQAEGATA